MVTEDTSIEEVVRLMEHHHIKRVPVLRDEGLVGIVSRSNLLHAFIVLSKRTSSAPLSDATIREQIGAELEKQPWVGALHSTLHVIVSDGIVDLQGAVFNQRQRTALRVVA